MPITEIVIGSLKPEVAKEGLAALRTGNFFNVAGPLSNYVGHIIRHNGKDIESEYRPLLAIEWESPESFYAFYPASEGFQTFAKAIGPYMAGKPNPKLYKPSTGYERSTASWERGAAQVFVGKSTGGSEGVVGAWDKFVTVLKGEGADVTEWNGAGIEEAEGTWTGVLGWRNTEDVEKALSGGSVAKAVQELRASVGIDEYIVKF